MGALVHAWWAPAGAWRAATAGADEDAEGGEALGEAGAEDDDGGYCCAALPTVLALPVLHSL